MILVVKGSEGEALREAAKRLSGARIRKASMMPNGRECRLVVDPACDDDVREWFNDDPITVAEHGLQFAAGTLLFFSDPVEG